MKRAIFIRIFAVLIIGLFICSVISAFTTSVDKTKQTQQEMLQMLRVIDQSIPLKDPDAEVKQLAKAADGLRITVIDPNGTVLGDSVADPATMESHKGREEFEEALQTGVGINKRMSETLGVKQLYVAVRSDKGVILRLSQDVGSLLANMLKLMPAILAAVAIALVISLVIAGKFSASLAKPLSEIETELIAVKNGGDLTEANVPYPELREISSRINLLAKEINRSSHKLENEREKLDCILNNMEEGILLIDAKQDISLLNDSVGSLLGGAAAAGENIVSLTRNMRFLRACADAVEKSKASLFDIEENNKTISVHITPVRSGFLPDTGAGAVIVLADVTADRTAGQLRQEFFSNASHELKTPITSIHGFAELLEQDIVPDEQQKKAYISRIKQESDRMINLINDILLISRLEQKRAEPDRSAVDLTAVAREIKENLLPRAAAEQITISVPEEPVFYLANPQQMHELLCNLMENAVKYNRPGGFVKVSLIKEEKRVILKVEDNGIGIPLSAQPRIFERFYRVDKGRSKKMGGTGLGLAIVKHIVNSYHGRIELKSTEGAGTQFKIILPVSAP